MDKRTFQILTKTSGITAIVKAYNNAEVPDGCLCSLLQAEAMKQHYTNFAARPVVLMITHTFCSFALHGGFPNNAVQKAEEG
jgi:hypothetical protein